MSNDARLEELIRVESNAALKLGSLIGLGIAAVTVAFVAVLNIVHDRWTMRIAFPSLVLGVTGVAWLLTRRGQMHGSVSRAMFLGTAMVPFAYLGLSEALLPFGAATYLFAPVVWSSFLIIIMSAFLMDPGLTRRVGTTTAIGYLLAYAVFARQHLNGLQPLLDPQFAEDVTSPAVHALRGGMLFGAGLLAAGVCTTARKLLTRVRDEEREKMTISRMFGEYVSPEVKDKLLAELTNLRGERRRVAVLFSDLRGFTTFSEGKEPAVVVDRLNQYFDRMVDAISRNGGTVDKFIGDAVMATFGGLIPVDNPAAAALNASLAMRAELKTLNDEWGKQGLSPLDNGIGVHFGDVLQGPIGSSTRKEFTVIGDVVNTASRLESVTKELGCPVVFSAVARETLPEAQRSALTPLGEIKLKGKADAVEVWGLRS